MKKILYTLLIISNLGLANILKAQEDVNIENADAVYEKVMHEFIINEDSSSIYNYSHSIKLLTYQSFQRFYGESFITYNPDYQKLKIKQSETIMADGITKVESPDNAYNEVLPRFAAHAAPYMNYKEMVVTHIGLEKNATINFAYSIESKKDFMPGIHGKIYLRDHSPIKDMEVRVVVPKGRTINYKLLNLKQEPEIQNIARWTVYKWNFKNIPLLEDEHNQPYWGEHVPTLFVSAASKEHVASYISENYDKLVESSDAIKKKAEEITNECTDNLSKIKAIQNYISSEVGSTYISPEVFGYKPYCAKSIFKNNVGNQLDRAILMTSMAKSVNIEAYPIFASNYKEYSTDIALLEQFRETYVYFPNEKLFVNPEQKTHQFTPNDLKGKAYFAMNMPEEVIEIEEGANSFVTVESEIAISPELKSTGKATFESDGYFRHELNKDCLTKELKIFLNSSTVKVAENVEITSFEKGEENKANIKFIETDLKKKSENLYLFELPGANYIVDKFHLNLGSDQRQTDLRITTEYKEEYIHVISIPENFQIVNLETSAISIKNGVGELSYSASLKGNKLTVKRSLEFKKNIVKAEDYKAYVELLSTWKQDKYKRLYLKKK